MLYEHWNIILLQIVHDLKSPRTQHFAHNASNLKIQSELLSLRNRINDQWREYVKWLVLAAVYHVFFLICRLAFWLSRTKRNHMQPDLDVAEVVLWTPSRQTRKLVVKPLTNRKNKKCCPTSWALRSGDTAIWCYVFNLQWPCSLKRLIGKVY